MSFTSGTQCELIFTGFTAGTALTNSTTQTCISPRGNTTPLPYTPASFFHPAYGTNRAIRYVARGVVSTAASSPGTLTIGITANTTDTATLGSSGNLIGASGALTPATSLSNAIWEYAVTIVCGAPGSTPTFSAMGTLQINPTAAAGATYGCGGTSSVQQSAYSTESALYWQLSAQWGTASASNSITMYETELWGLN